MRVGFGCVNLGSASSSASPRDQVRLIREAVDGGITLFDTADAYGGGSSETILGRALGGRRDEITLSTKAGYVFRPRSPVEQFARRAAVKVLGNVRRIAARGPRAVGDGAGPSIPAPMTTYREQDFSVAHITAALESSLERLRTDYVDVLQLHGPGDPGIIPMDLLDQLEGLRDRGLVRRFGVGAESVASALEWSSASNLAVLQVPFGVLDPEAGATVYEPARRRDVEVWARGALGGGVLAAAMADLGKVAGDPNFAFITGLADLASRAGMRLDELAIRWLRNQVDGGTVVVGISSSTHLRRLIDLSERRVLSDELIAAVEATRSATTTDPSVDR